MLWVSKFGIVNGEPSEDSPWVGAFPDANRSEDAADLYVIVYPALPGAEEFCADLRDAIGQTFHQKRITLTGGMLRALKAAHENLREWNSRSLREHQIAAGATLFAVRPDGSREAYMAQVGPTSAVVYKDFRAREVVPQIPDADGALGIGDEFRPQFTRWELSDGDRFVVLTPGPAQSIGEEEMTAILELPAEDAVKELFRRLRQHDDAAVGAVLVAVEPDPVEETALQPTR